MWRALNLDNVLLSYLLQSNKLEGESVLILKKKTAATTFS